MKYLTTFIVPVTLKLDQEQTLEALGAINIAFLGRPQLLSLSEQVEPAHEAAAHRAGRSQSIKIEVGLCRNGVLEFIRKV